MSLKVDIENGELIAKTKRADGSTYYMQEIFVHTVGRNGEPNRYPERCEIYAPRDPQGKQIAMPVGTYVIAPESFRVEKGRLELGFLSLKPQSKTGGR